MSTTISIQAHVLAAMCCFTMQSMKCLAQSTLTGVLMEVTPGNLRLVATDTHVLGILHLTAPNAYLAEIECNEPTSLILPVDDLTPLLKEQHDSSIRLTVDGLQVTAGNWSGSCLSVIGRNAGEYPCYERIIPGQVSKTVPGFSVDAVLLTRFSAFARALRTESKLSLSFHDGSSLISIYLLSIPSFYGLLAPCRDDGQAEIPVWLQSVDTRRSIRFREFDRFSGVDEVGNTWARFSVAEMIDQHPGLCAICRQVYEKGWHCLDSGESICDTHVILSHAESPGMRPSTIPTLLSIARSVFETRCMK